MEKKAKFFRDIVANIVIVMVLGVTVAFVAFDNAAAVPADEPIYRGTAPQTVSVMFNVYWGTEYLDSILQILAEHQVQVTFFVGGTWVAEHNAALKKIYNAGHEIGNHGFFNKDHKIIGEERNREEIELTHKLVKSILGIEMNLFTPPSGSFSQTTLFVAKELGYRTVLCSKDSGDRDIRNAEQIFSHAVSDLNGGDLVLMHPTKETVSVLARVLDAIRAKGLQVGHVGEVIGNQ